MKRGSCWLQGLIQRWKACNKQWQWLPTKAIQKMRHLSKIESERTTDNNCIKIFQMLESILPGLDLGPISKLLPLPVLPSTVRLVNVITGNFLVLISSTILQSFKNAEVIIKFCADVCNYKSVLFCGPSECRVMFWNTGKLSPQAKKISFHTQLQKVVLCKTLRSINQGPLGVSKVQVKSYRWRGLCCNCS